MNFPHPANREAGLPLQDVLSLSVLRQPGLMETILICKYSSCAGTPCQLHGSFIDTSWVLYGYSYHPSFILRWLGMDPSFILRSSFVETGLSYNNCGDLQGPVAWA